MRTPNSLGKQRGMSLIEVLFSLLIFSIGILGLVALEAKATQVSLDSEDRNRASILANEGVAAIWTNADVNGNLPAANLAAWQARVSATTSPTVGLPGGSGSITTVSTPGSPPVITVLVTWQEPSHANISQLSTSIIYNKLDN